MLIAGTNTSILKLHICIWRSQVWVFRYTNMSFPSERKPLLPAGCNSNIQISEEIVTFGGQNTTGNPIIKSTWSPQAQRWSAIIVLTTFSLNNMFNCWCFLNFMNFDPVKELVPGATHVTAYRWFCSAIHPPLCMHMCVYVYVCVCVCMCMFVCVCICMYVYVCVVGLSVGLFSRTSRSLWLVN